MNLTIRMLKLNWSVNYDELFIGSGLGPDLVNLISALSVLCSELQFLGDMVKGTVAN